MDKWGRRVDIEYYLYGQWWRAAPKARGAPPLPHDLKKRGPLLRKLETGPPIFQNYDSSCPGMRE